MLKVLGTPTILGNSEPVGFVLQGTKNMLGVPTILVKENPG